MIILTYLTVCHALMYLNQLQSNNLILISNLITLLTLLTLIARHVAFWEYSQIITEVYRYFGRVIYYAVAFFN